jgi:hypothetical protein
MSDDATRTGEAKTEVPFRAQSMVDWLSPTELARAGVKAVLAGVFGTYADRREIQKALAPKDPDDLFDGAYHDRDELWLDYTADVGDGFNPTYAVAWAVSRSSLAVPGVADPLPRGELLVLGGDEVYPTASRTDYYLRFHHPYRTALPDPDDGMDLYAIPGNHDWYDGLTSFLRLFTQGRRLGGWRTRQTRSYFALRLPHHWYLWGLDQQLESYIDYPQLDYFEAVAAKMKQLAAEDGATPRLILVTPEPTWVYSGSEGPEPGSRRDGPGRLRRNPFGYANLRFFEDKVVRGNGIELAAVLSGDLHHYVRYEEVADEGEAPVQRVTCGTGGAYLYPTHHMPAALELPDDWDPQTRRVTFRRYERRGVYPRREESRRLGRRVWGLPVRNWSLCLLMASIYFFFGWMMEASSAKLNDGFAPLLDRPVAAGQTLGEELAGEPAGSVTLMDVLARLGPGDLGLALHAYWRVLRRSPASLLLMAAVVLALIGFRRDGPRPPWRDTVWGAVHGIAHLGLAFALLWGLGFFRYWALAQAGPGHPLYVVLPAAGMFVAGWFFGGWLFAAYLFFSAVLSDAHHNEVFSSLHMERYKGFLRLRVSEDGVTVYPVGIPKPPQEWNPPAGEDGCAPAGGGVETVLMEEPYRLG